PDAKARAPQQAHGPFPNVQLRKNVWHAAADPECPLSRQVQMRRTNMISRRALLSSSALLPALPPRTAAAQQTTPRGSLPFSFAVYGGSRSMMYLPYRSDQREEAIKLMVDMFELVLPEKVAEEVVRRDVKLTYDPSTDELIQIVMPFESKSE